MVWIVLRFGVDWIAVWGKHWDEIRGKMGEFFAYVAKKEYLRNI